MFIFWVFGEFAGVLGIFYSVATFKWWLLPLSILLYFICRMKLDRHR
jgi:hypothetical protein